MSKVAVISSNGRVARLVVEELVNRGYEVVGFGREAENASKAQSYVQKDLFDITADDIKDADVVVSAFGTWAPETLHLHVKVVNFLSDLLAGSDKRLVIVGGAGSLYMDKEHTLQLVETPDFPQEYYPLAKAQTDALDELRKRTDVKWTFVSPAADFQAEGERTGEYILAGDEFTVNSKGESIISYADYAIAFADEIEKGNHIQERISLVRK
ncbi:NAD(P)-dependent oxidoreductase [Streptococcus sciuri]|uniref:NAD(P)-dependent oxidoreductase n=1 Tax=Streptococcus sciuri TaxID=2973939 RepID=A0ABT2F9E8_9STRE|nr:NAD(P)-dependent oxidoreductase [Streptococcus sciuri]MCS4488445.1 NAD(P)-dependent oxidoreductase [Streptococcus sciuri]